MNKLWYGFWMSGVFLAGMNCALNLAKLVPTNPDKEGSWVTVAASIFFSVVIAIIVKRDIYESDVS